MKRIVALLLVALLVAGVLSGCGLEKPEPASKNETTDSNKDAAPDFTVYDKDNKPVKLSDLRGKPVVLNFWATWCGPCTQELPHFQAKYKAENTDVQFMMVNLTDGSRETVGNVRAFLSSKGYTFPVYYDTTGQAAQAYGVQAIPTTYFIDAKGNLVASHTGYLSQEDLQKNLDLLTK